jgi:hypothetical protein
VNHPLPDPPAAGLDWLNKGVFISVAGPQPEGVICVVCPVR